VEVTDRTILRRETGELQDDRVTGEGPSTSRRWIWFLVVGAAAIAFYYLLPLTRPAAVLTDITALVFPVLATGGVTPRR
jgi:hypothetical protein